MKFEWVEIPAGEFTMGTSDEEVRSLSEKYQSTWFVQETPQKVVYLDKFLISKYPVTNAQYKVFIDAAGYRPPVSPDFAMYSLKGADHLANHPVAWVSWYDALAFCQWANCRLPTSGEWEKAARGPDGFKYPWGNEWRDGFCNSGGARSKMSTTPVGQYPEGVSPYGVYDMAGNVWEWTDDWLMSDIVPNIWHLSIESQSLQMNSAKLEDGEQLKHAQQFPVLRGGAVNTNEIGARCAFRLAKYSPRDFGDWVGFRLVKFP